MTRLVILIALGIIQNACSQAIGIANGGCNNFGGNGFIPAGLAPNGIGLVPNGLGCSLPCGANVGYGDVAVTGELPVCGSTSVAGQVPVIGYVTFEGLIPAGGLVSVANGCGCGC